MSPRVSFIVPCYNLGHFLAECVDSILSQTYRDFEVLIMDDASPDHTAEVARSIADPRVRYIRNEPNLGHLRNYNKGIALARGKYVWLISADDRLRCDYVLQTYVDLMESNPRIGYVFCPGMDLVDGREVAELAYSRWGAKDAVIPGRTLFRALLERNFILACSGLVRRECYEQISVFPLDLRFAGDWFLWAVFALHFDVGYCAEPMVSYRRHALSMTNHLQRFERNVDNLKVLWRLHAHLLPQQSGLRKQCLRRMAALLSYYVAAAEFASGPDQMTRQQADELLAQYCPAKADERYLRACMHTKLADGYYARGDLDKADAYYALALRQRPFSPRIALKRVLARSGSFGGQLRSVAQAGFKRTS